jgi:1,4-alpha-glucan branching enzyme
VADQRLGSVPDERGTSFRVWAPNASSVAVAGSFNSWSTTDHPLSRQDSGCWAGHVDGAKPGDQYKYVIEHNGVELRPWRSDPRARAMTSSIGDSIIHDPDFVWDSTTFPAPGWDELVIYELHVGTYRDAPGGGPGRLPDVIAGLEHLVDLGVTAIQLLPPAEFPGGFSWGYNPSSPFTVETDYGGPDALKRLIAAAHSCGLAVLCDVVYNHLGPGDLGLWRFDGWYAHDKGGIYFYNDHRDRTPWGHNRPDYGRGEVRDYLCDNAIEWLEEFRFDGLRFDATNYIRNIDGGSDPSADLADGWALLQQINSQIRARQPWKISIAEDMQGNPWITKRTEAGGAGFGSQWDADFVHPVRHALTQIEDSQRDVHAVATAIRRKYNDDALQRVIYTESHDEVAALNGKLRLPEAIHRGDADSWFAKKRSTLGAVLVFTSPGIPMIFQGQEFLEDGSWHDDDPVDWAKLEHFPGIVQLYRDLISLRRNRNNTSRGLRGHHVHVHHVNDSDKVLAFHRFADSGPRDSVVVLANLATRAYPSYTVGVPRAGLWRVRFNSDWTGYDPGFGNQSSVDTFSRPAMTDGMQQVIDIGLGPYSAVILSQDE